VKLNIPEGYRLGVTIPKIALDIRPKANVAVVALEKISDQNPMHPVYELMLADLKTGELTPVNTLMGDGQGGKAVQAALSPDGEHLLVQWVDKDSISFHAIRLPDGEPVKLAEGYGMAIWAGEKVALLTQERQEDSKPSLVRLIDPEAAKSQKLPLRGILIAGISDESLIVIGNPDEPAMNNFSEKALSEASLCKYNVKEETQTEITPIGIVSCTPEVSDNGKYVAFQSKSADTSGGNRANYSFRILSVDDENEAVALPKSYLPVQVLDDGSAIVTESHFEHGCPSSIRWISSDGEQNREIVKAITAIVIGNKLIYANTDGEIKTMAFPERK
jgi:hypothetical protein